VLPSWLSCTATGSLFRTRRLWRLMGKGTDRVSSPRPAKAGEGGPGLATTHAGGWARHDQTDQCSSFAFGSVEGPPAGFHLFLVSVHLSHTERRLSVSHFLDNASHFLEDHQARVCRLCFG
jgi:hypothetical protein